MCIRAAGDRTGGTDVCTELMAARLADRWSIARTSVLVGLALGLGVAPSVTAAARDQAGEDLSTLLTAAGERVAEFFARAQQIVCLETVELQPLGASLRPEGFTRTVVSELRLTWDPGTAATATEAQTLRQVVSVNGRPPRPNDRDRCTSPEQQESETQPLSMLLPAQRDRYVFTIDGRGRIDGRDATILAFRELGPISAEVRAVEGLDDCMSYDVKGGQRGRLWVDRETADVLRLDQSLPGMVDLRVPPRLARRAGASTFLTLERADTSIRFRRVTFREPDETIVLPVESTEVRVMRNGGTPRLRTVTRYSDYRRFLTGGRLLGGLPAAEAR